MAQITPTPASHPKHDIHKFQDVHPKLSKTNWVSWKYELLGTSRDRGIYATITGVKTLPLTSRIQSTGVDGASQAKKALCEKVDDILLKRFD